MISKSEVSLKSVVLYNKDKSKTLEILSNVVEIKIHESIFNFNMYGDITILDVENIFEKFNFVSEECMVQIKIASASEDNLKVLDFFVDAVTDLKPSNDNSITYSLKLSSIEAYTDKLSRISKGYCGTKQSIIGDIMAGLSAKQYISCDMNDENKVLFPYMHPFNCIDLLLLYGSDVFDCLFWENFRGFNLNRVLLMLDAEPKHHIFESQDEILDDKDLIKNPEKLLNRNRISKYSVSSYKNSRLGYLKDGALGSIIQTYDSITGLPQKYSYGTESDSMSKTYIFNNTNLCYQFYGSRHNLLYKIKDSSFDITVKGDINRCSGDTVFVEITNGSIEKQYDKNLSGSFLITEILHSFGRSGYTQYLKISR